MIDDKIAVQLYTLRELTARDMLGTLRAVAEQGYRAVEFAGFSQPVEEIQAHLDELGVRAISVHTGIPAFEADPQRVLSEARALGCDYVVVAYVAEELRRDTDQVHQLCASFDRYGALCRDAGLRFAYHNHNFEFAPLEGTTMFDLLVERTDPSLVNFELDVYWAQFAGVDPVETLKRLPGRVPLLHAKDMWADETRGDAPVGSGILPWREILGASVSAGVEYYIVEQDNPGDPLIDVAQSLRSLQAMLAEVL